MDNPWINLPDNPPYVLDEDKSAIDKYNQKSDDLPKAGGSLRRGSESDRAECSSNFRFRGLVGKDGMEAKMLWEVEALQRISQIHPEIVAKAIKHLWKENPELYKAVVARSGDAFKRWRIPFNQIDFSGEVLLSMSAGDAAFFTNYTWHRSEPNRSGGHKCAYAIAYQLANDE